MATSVPLWKLRRLVAPEGPQGLPGEDGRTALSMYELAVREGFVGSFSDWTATMVGPQGPPGTNGTNGTNGINGVSPPKFLYRGTTIAGGVYSQTYATPFTSPLPNIQVQLIGGTPNQRAYVTSSTLTGFSVTVYQTNSVNLLGIDVLLAATGTVVGAIVDVAVFK